MQPELLDQLNPQQRAAVTAGSGPVLVLAGPGSGKTRVLTYRIAYLIQEMNIAPWQIMAVTFTNKAAAEMRDRVRHLTGGPMNGLQLGTFHATCARILRQEAMYTPYREDFVIYDTDDQLSAVAQALNALNIDSRKYTPRRVLSGISAAKNELILPEEYEATDYIGEVVQRVYERYQAILLDSNALDFDDLLVQMVLALRQHEELRHKYQRRYDHILVDEFQDTNTVQYQLVNLFGRPQNNIFVVGDEDQSIYAFRGADYRNVMRFRQDYPDSQVILLEQNYRSTQVVLDVARAIINRNEHRTPKALFTTRQGGDKVAIFEGFDDDHEARWVISEVEKLRRRGIPYGEIAIMYRTNAQSRALERACVEASVPYSLVGGVGFYKRREVRDMLAYLRLVLNPDDRSSFSRVINTPKRGIGNKSLSDFQYWAADERLTYAEALDRLAAGQENPLKGRSATAIAGFATLLQGWRAQAEPGRIASLLDRIQADIGYNIYLNEISDTPDQLADRSQNLAELRGLAERADIDQIPLGEFLADQMLMTDADTPSEGGDRITLLTLHAAKGLEFGTVFITGLEDGLLPHMRAYEEPDGMSEERRLFYVGITRARDRLYLTHAFRRALYGSGGQQERSAFLLDVPVDQLDATSSKLLNAVQQQDYRAITRWDTSPSRLERDLARARADEPDEDFDQAERRASIRSKIVPFPGTERSKPRTTFRPGQRVRHAVFGDGIVLSAESQRDDEEVTVAFRDTQGNKIIKRILLSIGGLNSLDG